MRQAIFPLLVSLGFVASCTIPDARQTETPLPSESEIRMGLIADGEAIVVQNCTLCHAVGPNGESPRGDAPPLRYALNDRDVEALAADFREGIHVGSEDMPDFDFGPLGTDAVIAYIQSIQEEGGS